MAPHRDPPGEDSDLFPSFTPPMRIEIEKFGRTTVMYVHIADAIVARTEQLEEDVLADYDAEGRIVGFELFGQTPLRSAGALGRIRARFRTDVPSLGLLDELIPA